MLEIKLTNSSKVVQVDDADYLLLVNYRWRLVKQRNTEYAATGQVTYMHSLILPNVSMVDHKDGNGLNNQRENLRPTNYSFNQLNTNKYRKSKSKYKGVSYFSNKPDKKKWVTRLYVNGKSISLGCFETEVEAAKAYNDGLTKYCNGQGRPNVL